MIDRYDVNGLRRISHINWALVFIAFRDRFVIGEESPICKAIETVKGYCRITVERIELVWISDTIRIDFIEIRSVRWMLDFRYVWRFLLS